MGEASALAVEIRAGEQAYPAIVGPGVLADLPDWMARVGLRGRARIVADARAWSAHGELLRTALSSHRRECEVTIVAPGEDQKSLAGAERLYEWLIRTGTQRGDCVVAVGGGVVGDLAGFVAATFLRGLPLIHVPTTLLAMVDSSIGGKVAVNHQLGKNLIGAFHQPRLVVADTRWLRGLPPREYRSGWAEIVKIAMIADGKLFGELRREAPRLLAFADGNLLGRVIRRAVQLKGEIVGEDEREDGRRIILNYGHTIGHALEAATSYSRYLHGEAVAIGMHGAAAIAGHRGLLDEGERRAQAEVLAAFGLPSRIDGVAAEALLGPLARDKKARGKTIRWVLADGIGSVTTADDVAPEEVLAALRSVGCS